METPFCDQCWKECHETAELAGHVRHYYAVGKQARLDRLKVTLGITHISEDTLLVFLPVNAVHVRSWRPTGCGWRCSLSSSYTHLFLVHGSDSARPVMLVSL